MRVELTSNLLSVQQQLQLLALSPQKRKAILRKVGAAVTKDAKHNYRKKIDVDGNPFAAKSEHSRKRKRTKLAKGLKPKTSEQQTEVGYRNRLVGHIAYDQQHGKTENWTASELTRIKKRSARDGSHFYSEPMTRRQARRLVQAGFRVKRKSGRGTKRPSIRDVMNMGFTQGQFGAIYRELSPARESWTVRLPARPYLGMPAAKIGDIIRSEIINQLQQS